MCGQHGRKKFVPCATIAPKFRLRQHCEAWHSHHARRTFLTMNSLWDDKVAAQHPGDLAQRVYTSRLLGADKSLVMHGGGNTSVKITETNILGEDEDLLYVKGSGWDLATIEAEGFAPVRMKHLLGM